MGTAQYLTKDFVPQMFDLAAYAFNFQDSTSKLPRFKTLAEHSLNYGDVEEGILTSQVMATPFKVNFHGTIYTMAGVGMVSSYPEYRGQGGINRTMAYLLKDLNERGIDLSYLAPFSYPFYRRYGYELLFERILYKLPANAWPQIGKTNGKIQRCSYQEIQSTVDAIYHARPISKKGGLEREDWWLDYKFKLKAEFKYAQYISETGEVEGYIVYRTNETVFVIQEMGYLNKTAFKALIGFIGSHSGAFQEFHYESAYNGSNLNYLLPSAYLNMTIRPEMMGRIINFERFLAKYPFKKGHGGEFYLKVTEDAYAKWNEGVYRIIIGNDGNVQIEKMLAEAENPLIEGTIQALTQLLFGFRKASELAFFERIKGDEQALRDFSKMLVDELPILEDYF